jgi:predicted nucleic acid-binding protein
MIIVDASIAIKWLNYDEEGRDATLALYEKHFQKEETISVPIFFL